MSSGGSGRRRGATGRVLAGRIALGVVTALALGFAVVVAWAGANAARALPHIERAQQLAGGLDMSAVLGGDAAQLGELQSELAAARDATGGPVWSLAEGIPWVGPQFAAARTLTETLDDLVDGGLSAAAEAGDGLDALLPREGRIDVAALGTLSGQIDAAHASVTGARDRIATIDRGALVGPLRDGAAQVDALLAEIEPALDGASRAAHLLPGFLGADGPREHLLLVQNNAEWRSLGGIVGSVIEITATDGRIEFTDQVAASSFGRRDAPVTPLEFETQLIFGDRPARYMQNPTMIPDFAEAAHVASEFWRADRGGAPTGVIAIDPVALSYLLEATGPVQLPTGDVLASDNAVQLLLNEVYLRYTDPAEQDAFFGVAADAVFDALLSGSADPAAALNAVSRAIDERRLLVWSSLEQERALLEGTPVAGEMPASDARTTAFGVYLNDGVGAKLDYYMAAGSGAAWCGDGTAVLSVALRNDAPADIAGYPAYLLGTSGDQTESGAIRGITRTLTHVYLPEGAELIDGAEDANLLGQHAGHLVYEWTTDLAPGESATLDARVRVTTGDRLDLVSTPVIHGLDVTAGC